MRELLTDTNGPVMPDSKDPAPDFSDVSGGSSSAAMARGEATEIQQTYTVVPGDSLSKISKHFYGDAADWKIIWEANKAQIKNPDLIQIGQVLNIPKK